ncbi:MAG: RNA polymerase sigma factor [Acidobacteriota bacterium]
MWRRQKRGFSPGGDSRLVRRLLVGDERAFDEFFRTFFPRLFRFAMPRLAGRTEDAEDVVQATLVKALSHLRSYRGEAALFTWLCTICRREIGAQYRHREARLTRVDLVEDSPEIRAALESLAAVTEAGPETVARTRELSRLVQLVLDRVPPRYGDALEWKYIDGMPVREIAARMGVGLKAAESVLTRARAAFREVFREVTGRPPAPRVERGV